MEISFYSSQDTRQSAQSLEKRHLSQGNSELGLIRHAVWINCAL
jgi:hypothetical protein